jgi:hypothetical protein
VLECDLTIKKQEQKITYSQRLPRWCLAPQHHLQEYSLMAFHVL